MRYNYLRTSKLISLVIIFVFLAEYFLDKPALRSSNIDLERQIDLAFAREDSKKERGYLNKNENGLNENSNQVDYGLNRKNILQ